MLLDLWNIETLTQRFMELYNLTGIQICNIIRQLYFSPYPNSVSIFCEETRIKLDEVDVANNIEFVGKIVSTTTDNFDYLKQVGLVPIDFLIENDSPISRHLRRYGIEIELSRHELIYNGKNFYLPSDVTDCKYCAYGFTKCKFENNKLFCKYYLSTYMLGNKLFDNAEIEMFLMAPKSGMRKYSNVVNFPEILYTIDTLMERFFGENLDIGGEWSKEKQTSYIVTINVNYDDLTHPTEYVGKNNSCDAINTYYKYKEYCLNVYNNAAQIPKYFFDNIWLIKICLNTIFSIGEINGQICAGVKNNVKFPYNKLKIEFI